MSENLTTQNEEALNGTLTKGEGSISSWPKGIEDKFSKIDDLLLAVIIVLVVMVVTMIFMVATLMIDAWRFNSATYREYSEKIDTLNSLQESNSSLTEQNVRNQELIIQQQTQILELLNNTN